MQSQDHRRQSFLSHSQGRSSSIEYQVEKARARHCLSTSRNITTRATNGPSNFGPDLLCSIWPTLQHVPGESRSEWTKLFVDNLPFCFLAVVGGAGRPILNVHFAIGNRSTWKKSRAEAVSRTVHHRLLLWKTGNKSELWQRLLDDNKSDHKNGNNSERNFDENRIHKEAQRIARLLDQGLLSRVASQLSSRGVAAVNAEIHAKISKLFPACSFPLKTPCASAPTFEIQRRW